MSTIKVEFDSEDKIAVTAVSAMTFSLLGAKQDAKIKEIPVTDAEEVKAAPPIKAPTPRPSRAKAKPVPVEEEAEDEDEIEEATDDLEDDETEEEEITMDDLRAEQARTITKHKDALIAQYKKFDAKGVSSLDPKHYAAMVAFMKKLK